MDTARLLVDKICKDNEIHAKYLQEETGKLTKTEWDEFERIIYFYSANENEGINLLAEAYNMVLRSSWEERMFFVKHGRYRYATYAETSKLVYDYPDYMRKYMLGLVVSSYLWRDHRENRRWFTQKSSGLSGARYLEIGPGHGMYFTQFVANANFDLYRAIDISQTSVDMTRRYAEYTLPADKLSVVSVEQGDFFAMPDGENYDAIVMCEVLEHVENPLSFLEKIRKIAAPGSFIYINTCVNAPEIDHIYLFHTPEEITELFAQAGLRVTDYLYVTATESMTLEKAMKKKAPVFTAFTLTV